tara:strand:+ start:1226 stop:1654 length:429 start_codon:yes stop_codon:yes gene_type:complete
MKKIILAAVLTAITASASARDDIGKYPIAPLLESAKAKEVLLDIPLYFSTQKHKAIAKKYGQVSTNKKTNAFMKSDSEACEWVMLSALKALQERAVRENMDAVVNIESNYKNRHFASETEFECGAGAVMAGVALKGTLVKFK